MDKFRYSALALAVGSLCGAPAAQATCNSVGNLVPDCGFGSGIGSWSNTDAIGNPFSVVAYNAGEGHDAPGSVQSGNPTTLQSAASLCLAGNIPSGLLEARLWARENGGAGASCTTNLLRFDNPACVSPNSGGATSGTYSNTSTWQPRASGAVDVTGAQSLKVLVTCQASESFTGFVDDVVLAVPGYMFSDSFE